MFRGLMICLLCAFFLASALPAHAEVSVRLDRGGQYVTAQVIVGGAHALDRKIWSPRGRGLRKAPALNPDGDLNGDLFPAIAESTRVPYFPLVVWSRFDGGEYDLAWSMWTNRGWQPVRWLAEIDGAGDDLDPDLAFDSWGRAFVIWWRDEAKGGRVYVSTMLGSRWSAPYPISDPTADSRFPMLSVEEDGTLTVRYETPDGIVTGIVAFSIPDTITDDINPQVTVKVTTHYASHKKF